MDRPGQRIQRIERLLTPRNARVVLLLLALLTLPALFILPRVRTDHDFEQFFPHDDPELARYLDFRSRFGHDNEYVLLGIGHRPTVFELDLLRRVDSLAVRLSALPDVRRVVSPTRMRTPRWTPAGLFELPVLRLDHDSTLAADSARLRLDPVTAPLVNEPGDALLLVMHTEQGLSKVRSDRLLAAIENAVATSGLSQVHIAGRIHGQHHILALMSRELVVFLLTSAVLLALFLALAFRTVWGVAVPMAVVALTVLWQVALMTAFGKPLSILTMLLPTILFVVGVSDAVHIIERYIEALREGYARTRALAITLHEVGLSTFITMLTTAIGYATLVTSGIRPMSEFGLFTAMGVFLAYALAFVMLPAVLVLVPTPVPAERTVRASLWDRVVHALLRLLLRRRRLILFGAAGVAFACALLVPRIKVNNFLLEDLPDSDPGKQGFLWFEQQFGGVRPFDLEITVRDSDLSVWDHEVLRRTALVQDHLERRHGVHHITSPVTVVRAANMALHGGDPAWYRLPDDPGATGRVARLARNMLGREGLATIAAPDGRSARLSGRMVDEGGAAHRLKNATLEGLLQGLGTTPAVDFHQTGMAFLIDRNNERLSTQMLESLALSFLLIAAIMALLFREPRMVLVALLPNVLPLVVVAGFMGLAGIDLKVSTAIIFSNAFGIAVDDTVHLLGKLRIELAKGRTLAYAMKRTYLSGGKAVIVMSLMLCAGFVSLTASDFASVHYMGLLISITLGVALLSELLLLPLLVLFILRRSPLRSPLRSATGGGA